MCILIRYFVEYALNFKRLYMCNKAFEEFQNSL